ncbi:phosphatidylglycerophosphatase A [Desulfovibrio sp. OttesenSCG-928-F07]|nr:phosphatidylglycerophosphatase A [Desulfovibrio sp. OttesenSCG-928-F07]
MPKLFDRIILAFCRVEPAGLSPKAPGTMGSLVAILLAPFIFMPFSLPVKLGILVFLFIVGGFAATRAEKILGQEDPGSVVIDEVLGQWLAVLPFAALTIWELALAFALFRFFDITKPWPVKASENWLKGGFGIMIDDVFAGLYALLFLCGVRFIVATGLLG